VPAIPLTELTKIVKFHCSSTFAGPTSFKVLSQFVQNRDDQNFLLASIIIFPIPLPNFIIKLFIAVAHDIEFGFLNW